MYDCSTRIDRQRLVAVQRAKRSRSKRSFFHRPWLQILENRLAPAACTQPATEPWCLDDNFGTSPDGHASVNIDNC